MNMLAQGARWLADQQERHTSSPVQYRRGSDVYPASAVIAGIREDEAEAYEDRILSRLFDFLIPVKYLPVRPTIGDTVEDAAGTVYEVIANTFEGPFRYTEPQKIRYRIHTQQIGPTS